MILRKPYAFLIKHFQKINIFLFILTIYAFIKNLQLHSFIKEYLSSKVYNSYIDPISNYTSVYAYLALFGVLIITGILIYLLKHKDKPISSYVFIFVEYLFTLIVFIYVSSYFNNLDTYETAPARIVRDLVFIESLPQYFVFVLLFIRSVGIDLKSFGFNEDKEFIEANEEDREEVEVSVGFDYDKVKRTIKNRIRYLKYFFLEHKFSVSIVAVIIFLLSGLGVYNYLFVVNKVYTMNEHFVSNNYNFKVNATYITDKDYAGNVIQNGKYYVIVDLDVDNLLSESRVLDIEKFYLFTNDQYYVPATRFNTHFVDMGNLYDSEPLKSKQSKNYLLVFEIDKPDSNTNFVLAYQDVISGSPKLKKVKVKITDLSSFKTKGTKNLLEYLEVPMNNNVKKEMLVYNYKIASSFTYTYKDCDVYECYMKESTMTAEVNKNILFLKMNFYDDTNRTFLDFVVKYGKIKYKVGDVWYTSKLVNAAPRFYNGNYLYLLVEDDVSNASEIKLYFTIRTYQYFYVLKGN